MRWTGASSGGYGDAMQHPASSKGAGPAPAPASRPDHAELVRRARLTLRQLRLAVHCDELDMLPSRRAMDELEDLMESMFTAQAG